ncbi:MAG: hypothetical protein PHF51_01305 [Candidatus ainarchaeum sp.]|nr:hypothetical protein [Candidatus ainarchaeum sp.]
MAGEDAGAGFQKLFSEMTKQVAKAFSRAPGQPAKGKAGETGGAPGAMKPKKAEGRGLGFKAGYSLKTPGKGDASGEAEVRLYSDSLAVLPKFKEPLLVPLRSVTGFAAKDYRVELALKSDEKLALYDFGYEYENFVRAFSSFMNNLLLEDLLAHENVVKSGVEAEYAYSPGPEGREGRGGGCVARLYDSALVVIPEEGELLRVPYGAIYAISDTGKSLEVFTDYGGKLVLSMMGYEFDAFSSALAKAYGGLLANEQAALQALLPGADPLQVRSAASCMKEGRAVTKPELDAHSPGTWEMIGKRLADLGLSEGFDYLQSLSGARGTAVGVKQGLGWGTADYYLWFLVPVYSADKGKPGNAVAMEVPGKGSSKATYFFRLAGRGEYARLGMSELDAKAGEMVKRLSAAMIAINFRREPIYLPDDKLELPGHEKYAAAVRKIPELRMLRSLFIGRVIHASEEKWRKDARDLLAFNVSAKSDAEKWAGFAESTEPEEKEEGGEAGEEGEAGGRKARRRESRAKKAGAGAGKKKS